MKSTNRKDVLPGMSLVAVEALQLVKLAVIVKSLMEPPSATPIISGETKMDLAVFGTNCLNHQDASRGGGILVHKASLRQMPAVIVLSMMVSVLNKNVNAATFLTGLVITEILASGLKIMTLKAAVPLMDICLARVHMAQL